MKSHLLTASIALLAGIFVGSLWPRNSKPSKQASIGPQSTSETIAFAGAKEARLAEAKAEEKQTPTPSASSELKRQLHAAFLTGNPISRTLRFAELLESMTPENAVAFRALFFEFDKQGLTFDAEWRLLWHQWAKVDPVAALRALDEEGRDGRQAVYAASITEVIFSSWGEGDAASANAALAQIKDAELYNRAYLGILRGMDLAAASRFATATDFPDPTMASAAAERLAE
ncbi:MAG: hypothetical protein V4640_15350 [Verrucomicrobiota bacterium]